MLTYTLTSTEMVSPDAMGIVSQSSAYTATLFACHPKGSARERIVAHFQLQAPRCPSEPARAPCEDRRERAPVRSGALGSRPAGRAIIGPVMRRSVTALACLGTGLAIAAALPPWGWWPLAFVGVAGLDRLVADRPRRSRFRRGAMVGVGLYVPSLAWMVEMTLPGYVIAALVYAALLGLAMVLVPARAPGRWLAVPGAIALPELLRWSWPFGGVPLSSLAVGQVAGPLAPVLRIGGSLLLVELTVIVGVALAAALIRRWLAAGVGAALALGIVVAGIAGPRAERGGR